jgi:hypothetical protein
MSGEMVEGISNSERGWVGGVIVLSGTEEIKQLEAKVRETDAQVHAIIRKRQVLPPELESWWKRHLATCRYSKEVR